MEGGEPCDWWLYYDPATRSPMRGPRLRGARRHPVDLRCIRPGCWIQKDRLVDMTANHVDVFIRFHTSPASVETFFERQDKDLALLCVQRFNYLERIRRSGARGRQGSLSPIPLGMIPLWDPSLAAAEVAGRRPGCFAVTFSENPHPLGLPSGARQGPALGPVLPGAPGHRHRGVHAHRVVVTDAGDLSRRTAPSSSAPR